MLCVHVFVCVPHFFCFFTLLFHFASQIGVGVKGYFNEKEHHDEAIDQANSQHREGLRTEHGMHEEAIKKERQMHEQALRQARSPSLPRTIPANAF